MATRTHISLLGGFIVEVDGTAIPEAGWRLRKSRSVLKVLALSPGRALHPERLQALILLTECVIAQNAIAVLQ